MATDIDRLNMAGPSSPVSMNHSSSMHTANDASMRSSSVDMHDDGHMLSTPTSKRQRLSPLEVPEVDGVDLRGAALHRLSDSVHMNDSYLPAHSVTPHTQRFRDAHEKPPVSPSDPCYSGMDLRKAALLRSLMLATEGQAGGSERSKASSTTATASRRSQRLKKSAGPQPAGSASMEMYCGSNRSSISPDTATSNQV